MIEFENKKIGYVQYLISSKSLYINMLILEPHFQSQGIGARIINKIISIFYQNNKQMKHMIA